MSGELKPLSRRTLLAALASTLALAGCGGVMGENLKAAETYFTARRPKKLTRDEVAKYQAASIAIQVGRSRQGLILLNRISGEDCIWLSGDYVMIATRGGRIIATGGLPHNLQDTEFLSEDPVNGKLLTSHKARFVCLLDFPDDYGRANEARSEFFVHGPETLTILGAPIKTVRVSEKVRVPSLRWSFTNTYWPEASTGQVWKTKQKIHPDYPPITVTTMRPVRFS